MQSGRALHKEFRRSFVPDSFIQTPQAISVASVTHRMVKMNPQFENTDLQYNYEVRGWLR